MSIFVNRVLNLRDVQVIGFDMDHTLVRYNVLAFEKLAFEEAIRRLIRQRSYPDLIAGCPFEPQRVIRGLVVDKRRGNLLKLSLFGRVKAASHGHRPLEFNIQKALYRDLFIDLTDTNFQAIDTSFSLAYAVLLGHLVRLKDEQPGLPFPSYEEIADDIQDAIDQAHRDNSLKGEVRRRLPEFIRREAGIVRALERMKRYGKRLIIITNSDYDYTRQLLDYAFNPLLEHCRDWTGLFEFVITLAGKPRFFTDTLPFLRVDPATGLMSNLSGRLLPGIYQGGSANRLQQELGLNGEEILYLGDHIYGDIVSLKKSCNWRTALVIEELEGEIAALRQGEPVMREIVGRMHTKIALETRLDELYTRRIEHSEEVQAELGRTRRKIQQLDRALGEGLNRYRCYFNPAWGEIMRAGQEESRFAGQVEKYACIYMTSIADFLDCSPRHYFRPRRRPMAHEDAAELID